MRSIGSFYAFGAVLLLAYMRVAAAQTTVSFASPLGGEVYVIGQTQTVRINGRVRTVDIELSTDGGATFSKLGTINNTKKPASAVNALPYSVAGPVSSLCILRATVTGARGAPITATSGMFSIIDKLGSSGTTTGTGNAALADGSVTTPKLAAGAVTIDKLSSGGAANGAVLTADGGGHAAYLPLSVDPTAIASGLASAGMVLTADGSGNTTFNTLNAAQIAGKVAQATAADTAVSFTGTLAGDVTGTQNAAVVGRIVGVPVAPTAPANGQVLQFNAVSGRWEPAAPPSAPIQSIAGTANQIIAANNAGVVTLSTPQDLAPASSVTFAGVTSASGNFSGGGANPPLSSAHTNNGVAANFTSQGPTAVTISAGSGPALDCTGTSGDGMHALTLGTSTSGIYAEADADSSYGIYAISYGTQGQGRAGMFVGYTRDGYAVEIRNGSSDAGYGGGMLVDQEGTTNNIAVFQSQKVTQIVFDNAGTGHFPRLTVGGAAVSSGAGAPNGAVAGNPGDLYLNTTGGAGATLWVKESGSGTNTGWVAK